ncbi:hypothetical protein [Streptomyces justiciae]|nr:hypothetical protein [Streptomyces justiciae]MBE8475474.1 hypothetical protein [Streptomyces justiciae]
MTDELGVLGEGDLRGDAADGPAGADGSPASRAREAGSYEGVPVDKPRPL